MIILPVIVKSRDGKSMRGKLFIQHWDEKQRLKKSIKILAIGWGLAVLSIFLPIAHFFLVPGFFIGAIIVALRTHKRHSAVLGGESTCPQCAKILPLASGPEQWPLEDLCTFCQTNLIIEKDIK